MYGGGRNDQRLRDRVTFAAEGASLIFSRAKDMLNCQVLVQRLETGTQSMRTGRGGQQMWGEG